MKKSRIPELLMLAVLAACGESTDDVPATREDDSAEAERLDRLVLVDQNGSYIGTVIPPVELLTGPDFSSDYLRLAIRERSGGNDDIYVYDFASRERMRLTSDAAADMQPRWSPAGDRVAFFTYRNGLADIYVRAVEGESAEVPVVNGPMHEYHADWTPDGTELVFQVHDPETDARDIYSQPTSGGDLGLVVAGRAQDALPRLSPDGRFLAYQSDESGQWEVYVIPFPSGAAKYKVSIDGGLWPKWGPDGELYFFSGGTLMVAPVAAGQGDRVGVGAPLPLFTAAEVGMRDPSESPLDPLYGVGPAGQFAIVQRVSPEEG